MDRTTDYNGKTTRAGDPQADDPLDHPIYPRIINMLSTVAESGAFRQLSLVIYLSDDDNTLAAITLVGTYVPGRDRANSGVDLDALAKLVATDDMQPIDTKWAAPGSEGLVAHGLMTWATSYRSTVHPYVIPESGRKGAQLYHADVGFLKPWS